MFTVFIKKGGKLISCARDEAGTLKSKEVVTGLLAVGDNVVAAISYGRGRSHLWGELIQWFQGEEGAHQNKGSRQEAGEW